VCSIVRFSAKNLKSPGFGTKRKVKHHHRPPPPYHHPTTLITTDHQRGHPTSTQPTISQSCPQTSTVAAPTQQRIALLSSQHQFDSAYGIRRGWEIRGRERIIFNRPPIVSRTRTQPPLDRIRQPVGVFWRYCPLRLY
jgi:hypothetical protein